MAAATSRGGDGHRERHAHGRQSHGSVRSRASEFQQGNLRFECGRVGRNGCAAFRGRRLLPTPLSAARSRHFKIMQVRIYRVGSKNRLATIALVAAALAMGAVLIAFGLVLLLGLAAAGAVVGSGLMIYRRLTGRAPVIQRWSAGEALDPSIEVFPSVTASALPAASAPPPADHPANSASDSGRADPSAHRSSSSSRSSRDRV